MCVFINYTVHIESNKGFFLYTECMNVLGGLQEVEENMHTLRYSAFNLKQTQKYNSYTYTALNDSSNAEQISWKSLLKGLA